MEPRFYADKKRARKAAKNERDRLSLQDKRAQEKAGSRYMRVPERAGSAVIFRAMADGALRGLGCVTWAPSVGDVVAVIPGPVRTVIGVAANAVPAMLAFLASGLLGLSGAVLSSRSSRGMDKRGASVIFTKERSSSDPHRDTTPTLLLNVSGDRSVYWADPDALQSKGRSKIEADTAGTTFLSEAVDPSINTLEHCAENGLQWEGPVTLSAGDAIYIHANWWHCIISEAGGIAIPIEIKDMTRGEGPRVYRGVGTRVPSGSSNPTERVARRLGWGTAAGALELWAPALKAFEFRDANEKKIMDLISANSWRRNKCKSFTLKGIPCQQSVRCSMWPCNDWEEVLKSDNFYRERKDNKKDEFYNQMPNCILTGKLGNRGTGGGRVIIPVAVVDE